jgi:hypothetical protein
VSEYVDLTSDDPRTHLMLCDNSHVAFRWPRVDIASRDGNQEQYIATHLRLVSEETGEVLFLPFRT